MVNAAETPFCRGVPQLIAKSNLELVVIYLCCSVSLTVRDLSLFFVSMLPVYIVLCRVSKLSMAKGIEIKTVNELLLSICTLFVL